MSPTDIVNKLWNYCSVLRDDGMSYGDYVEQLTYLLFLKMADERSKPPYNHPGMLPEGYAGMGLYHAMVMNCLIITDIHWKPLANKKACWGSFSINHKTNSRTLPSLDVCWLI